MPADNILVLVVDGLRAAALGAYGNTTFATPALDQLAAESFLLDAAFADSTDLPAIYSSLWRSLHPLRPATANVAAPSMARQLSACGYHTTLLTDDPEIGSLELAADFDECVQLDGTATARAENVAETCLARLFAAGCEALQPTASRRESPHGEPRLVWVHSRGMFGPWDAPLALQESLLDHEEGDPAPHEGLEPPSVALADVDDTDAAYATGCAYAAQVMVIDDSIDLVRRCLAEMPSGERWLVVLTGSRGYALGEHGQIGGCEGRLFAEMLQIPLMLRFPDASGALARSQQLVSHLDLLPTLVEWVGEDSAGVGPIWDGLSLLPLARLGTTRWRDELVAANVSGQLAIRNSEWCLRREPAQSTAEQVGAALFVRPDDRYEVNDIASLCPEVVERLSAALDAASRNFAEGGDMLARDPSLEQRPQDIPL